MVIDGSVIDQTYDHLISHVIIILYWQRCHSCQNTLNHFKALIGLFFIYLPQNLVIFYDLCQKFLHS